MESNKLQKTQDLNDALGRVEWMLIAVAAVFLAFNTFTKAMIDNDRSRLASVDSLIERGTWIIDESRFHQEPGSDYQIIDKVQIGDHFYSSKPPVLPFLMAGEYWVLHNIFGYDFDDAQDRKFLIWILTFTFTGIPFLWIAVLFRIAARWFVDDPATRLVGLFVILFCNEHLGFAETINNHVPAASLLFSSMVLGLGLVHGKLPPKPWLFVATGVFAGLLPTVDLPAAFFCIPLWLYLMRCFPRQTLTWFTVGAASPLVLHFILTYVITGGLMPIYTKKDLYQYEGSYWNLKRGLDAAGEYESKHTYFFHLSVGRKGLFSLYPVLLLPIVHLFFVTSWMRWNVNRIALAVFAIVLPVLGWVAWAYNRDSAVPYYTTLAYFFVFALAPVAIVSLLVRACRQGRDVDKPELPLETLGMGLLTFAWMLFYTFKTDNYGGSATGYRWFMFFTPALQFFGLFSLRRMKRGWQWALVCLLVGIAFYSGWQASVRPWSYNYDWPVRFLGKWYTR